MKRSPKPGDINQRMYAVVQEAAGLSDEPQAPEKDPAAVARGRLGGQARARNLDPEKRRRIAEHAAFIRRGGAAAPVSEAPQETPKKSRRNIAG